MLYLFICCVHVCARKRRGFSSAKNDSKMQLQAFRIGYYNQVTHNKHQMPDHPALMHTCVTTIDNTTHSICVDCEKK